MGNGLAKLVFQPPQSSLASKRLKFDLAARAKISKVWQRSESLLANNLKRRGAFQHASAVNMFDVAFCFEHPTSPGHPSFLHPTSGFSVEASDER